MSPSDSDNSGASVVDPTSITSDPATVALTVGGPSVNLTANVTPSGATFDSVTWTIANNAIATVDESGAVSPVDAGTTTITGTVTYSGTKTLTVEIPVTVTAA